MAEYIAKIGTREVTHNNSLAKNKLKKALELFDFAGELSQTMSLERMNKKKEIQKLLNSV
ncbi:MAG TPA: hypothetical protein ENJ53_10425 [Phaeodactylibacter sp.]|nr:hypothetical protein [Phaeodactylibacter sp.]